MPGIELVRLNIICTPIAKKYCEGKLKSLSKWRSKEPEIVDMEPKCSCDRVLLLRQSSRLSCGIAPTHGGRRMRDMGNGIVFVSKISFVSGVTGAEAYRKSFTGLRRSLPSPFQQRDCYEGRNGDERRLTETARTMRKSCILSRLKHEPRSFIFLRVLW